ncbi:MAG: DUF5050 domain-containing protein [Bacillota bacterium]|nr:DUF5050 domain-containing protein [Bacillota bacterium]
MSHCINCDKEVQDNERFCRARGHPINSGDSTAAEDGNIQSNGEGAVTGLPVENENNAERPCRMNRFKFKAKYLILTISLISVLSVSFLHYNKRPNTNVNTDVNIFGNNFENLRNGGIAAEQGKWIYYSSENGLYKISIDGGNSVKLADGRFQDINVVDDFIYCNKVGSDNSTTMCKIKVDGKQQVQFGKGLSKSYLETVINDEAYFVNAGVLYRMKTDESDWTVIMDTENSLVLNIDMDNIYVAKSEGNSTDILAGKSSSVEISKVDIKSGKKTAIFRDNLFIFGIGVEEKFLYYVDAQDKKLVRMDMNTQEKIEVTVNRVRSFILYNGWIYYICLSDGRLYRVKLDGTENTSLTYSEIRMLSTAGGSIFYRETNGGPIHKMKPDGTEETKLND